MPAVFATATNQVAVLKELYTGDSYMKDLVYKKNPLLALIPKDESPSGFAGKYIPVPTVFATPQGRNILPYLLGIIECIPEYRLTA